MNNHIVAQQTNFGTALNHTFGNHTAGNLADTGNIINLAYLRITEQFFSQFRRKHTFKTFLDIIQNIINDGIILNLNIIAAGHITGLRIGTNVKTDNQRMRRLCQSNIGFGNRPDRRMQNLNADLIIGKFGNSALNCFNRTLNVGFDNNRQVFNLAGFNFIQHLFHGRFSRLNQLGLAFFANTVTGNFFGFSFISHNNEIITGRRRSLQSEHFYRGRRPGFLHFLAVFIKHRADMSPFFTGNTDITDSQCSFLYQSRNHRPAAFFHLGLNNRTFGITVGVGLQIKHFRLQQNRINQLVDIDAFFGGNFGTKTFAAHFLNPDSMLQQSRFNLHRIRPRQINFINSNHYRNFGRLSMADGLNRLRHDTVIGRNNQNHNIRNFGATGTHFGKSLMSRRIDKRNFLTGLNRNLISTDMLRNTAGLFRRNIRFAQRIKQ